MASLDGTSQTESASQKATLMELPNRELQTEPTSKKAARPRMLVILFSCIGVCLIAGAGGYQHVSTSFAGLVQSNSDELSILACELMCETGPDFTKPIDSKDFEEVLKSYSEYIEKKHLSVLLKRFPGYSPNDLFSHLNKILADPKSNQEEAANDIWQAGEKVMLFRLKTKPKFLLWAKTSYDYSEAAELFLPLAEKALGDSKDASDQFNNTLPTMENAVHSCERNRLTMLLLFPLRTSYDRPEVASLFAGFREVVNECRDRKKDVAGESPYDDPRKEFLGEIIARSEKRRLDILDAIDNRDMQKVIEHMWDAIETSYRDRTRLLQLCEEIQTAGNYSDPITP